MMKCKFYSEEIGKCLFDEAPDDCIFCDYFRPIEYEKESSPYRLNSIEINVFSKLVKEYIKDQDKLDKVIETFESYLSNSSKSPANAEGKCSDEDTFYRVMKERIEDEEEQKIEINLKEIKQDAVTQFVNLVDKKLDYYDRRSIKLSAFYLSSMMKEVLRELGYEG